MNDLTHCTLRPDEPCEILSTVLSMTIIHMVPRQKPLHCIYVSKYVPTTRYTHKCMLQYTKKKRMTKLLLLCGFYNTIKMVCKKQQCCKYLLKVEVDIR